MRKTISIIALCFSLMMSTVNIFADENISILEGIRNEDFDAIVMMLDSENVNDNDLRNMLIERELELREDDEEFKHHCEVDYEDAMAMVNHIVDNQIAEINGGYITYSGNNTNAWVSAPELQQSKYWWCGPCSVLQAAAGYGTYVEGTTNKAKQETIIKYINDTSSASDAITDTKRDGAKVYQVKNACNEFVGGGYDYKKGSNLSDTQFKNIITKSLINNKCPILHARTEYISYYDGHESGHYICLSAVNNTTNKVQLADCNFNDAYHGIRSIPRSEAKDSISNGSRYLISSEII